MHKEITTVMSKSSLQRHLRFFQLLLPNAHLCPFSENLALMCSYWFLFPNTSFATLLENCGHMRLWQRQLWCLTVTVSVANYGKVNTSFLLSRDSKCGWRRSLGIDTFGVAISCPGAWVMPQPREHHEDCQRIPPSPSFYGARETTEEKIQLKSTN